MLISAAFLPLTLTVVDAPPGRRPGLRAVGEAARGVERDAWAVWQSLLGGWDAPLRADLAVGLRRLTCVVTAFAGTDWWNGAGSGHRDRVTGYQIWLEEALAEGNGAEFAEAFAGYDEAVARAMVSRAARRGSAGRSGAPGRPATGSGAGSGTMEGWARQARAATSRAASPLRSSLRSPLRWATSRRETSSSRWSRRSRSAG